MISNPTWKSYLYLALVFFGCWPLLFLPALEPLFSAYPGLPLVSLVPLLASFIYGLKYGYKMLAGSALVSLAALSVVTMLILEDLMHDDTLIGGLRYAAGIGLKLTCIVVVLMVAGAFVEKRGFAAQSLGFIVGTVSLSVFLILSMDEPPVSYGLNYFTLQVVAAVLAAVAVLTLVALFANRPKVRIKGSV